MFHSGWGKENWFSFLKRNKKKIHQDYILTVKYLITILQSIHKDFKWTCY